MELQPGASTAIDEYLEYRRIVGEDDGGKLFIPEEYEEYKKKVLPIRLQNRLYVSWRSPTGMDCKLVRPETVFVLIELRTDENGSLQRGESVSLTLSSY
ncbi:UNVERIFIED_CONTAM: hypothetical protein K2H54_038923 [Gekko kuhli]